MVPFLKGFLNNLNAIQSKQILRILGQMRDRGEIRSPEDFNKKLTELADLIKEESLGQRTPILAFQESDLIDSDSMRAFTDYVRLDMEAALGETERLGNAMRAHNRILVENYLDALEAAVSDLESETQAYEVLESQKYIGFSSVTKVLSFRDAISAPGASASDPSMATLFVDGRGGQTLYYSPPGYGEEGIHLATNPRIPETPEYTHLFNKVEIRTSSTTPQTALSTSTGDNTPIRAIDDNKDTAWRHSVLLTEHPDACQLIFAPSFSGARRINALVIHPLTDVKMKIVSIAYEDSGGNEIDLPIGSAYAGVSSTLFSYSGFLGTITPSAETWILSNKKKIIPVGDIVARKFIITFQQDTGGDGDLFYYEVDVGSWQKNTTVETFIKGHMKDSGGPDGAEIPMGLGFIPTSADDGRLQGRFSEYVFGLKDICAIEREYESNGFFVPEPFTMKTPPNILALYSDAGYPVDGGGDIEFLIRKENYDSRGILLDVETFPMLPYGVQSVDERLFLTELRTESVINDTGLLRFYPDFTESFAVYSNDTQLTIGTNYTVSVDGGTTWESSLPPSSTPNDPRECLVKIGGPRAGAFIKVSYSPLLSSSEAGSEVWINPERTVRLGRFQTYVFDNVRPFGEVSECRIGLQIILRAHTLDSRVSPYLKEVVLLGG